MDPRWKIRGYNICRLLRVSLNSVLGEIAEPFEIFFPHGKGTNFIC
jgi:hypothetical protein